MIMPESGAGEDRTRFRVGYALPARKLAAFMVPPFIHHARLQGIDFVPIDVSKPLTHQGPFHCIIHKLYTHDWNLNLEEFSLQNPSAVVIDPPSAIQRLNNRISMLDSVAHLNIPQLGIPTQLLLPPDAAATSSVIDQLKFPVIAKRVVVDGSTVSHKMSLVFNRQGLTELEPPMVLQQFVNHGGIIFKVYVADEYVRCVKRSSLPDITEEMSERMSSESGGVICFSQISNSAMVDEKNDREEDQVEMPEEEFVTEVAKGLRLALGLHLFNFDMIKESGNGGYLVIDINYFPGYEKLPEYETLMTDFLLNVMSRQQRRQEIEV